MDKSKGNKLFIITAPVVAVLAVLALVFPVQLTTSIVKITTFFIALTTG